MLKHSAYFAVAHTVLSLKERVVNYCNVYFLQISDVNALS